MTTPSLFYAGTSTRSCSNYWSSKRTTFSSIFSLSRTVRYSMDFLSTCNITLWRFFWSRSLRFKSSQTKTRKTRLVWHGKPVRAAISTTTIIMRANLLQSKSTCRPFSRRRALSLLTSWSISSHPKIRKTTKWHLMPTQSSKSFARTSTASNSSPKNLFSAKLSACAVRLTITCKISLTLLACSLTSSLSLLSRKKTFSEIRRMNSLTL